MLRILVVVALCWAAAHGRRNSWSPQGAAFGLARDVAHGFGFGPNRGRDHERDHGRDHGRDRERNHGRDREREHGRDREREQGHDREPEHEQDHEPAHEDSGTSQATNPDFAPYRNNHPLSASYKLGIITDMDEHSRLDQDKAVWTSYLKRGKLSVVYDKETPCKSEVTVDFDSEQTLTSDLNAGLRGMELSALHVFNHRLLTCDDRTGIIFDIPNAQVKNPVPFVILNDGNGTIPKRFKCEWETEKNGFLYVGSHADTVHQSESNGGTQWVKRVSADGVVTNWDWSKKFEKLRQKVAGPTGYVMHESGVWDNVRQRWTFLPRQVNHKEYDFASDGCFGANLVVQADDSFDEITTIEIGTKGSNNPQHGFSSFKFVPNTNNNIVVALKSMECNEVKDKKTGDTYQGTWIMAFSMDGTILLPEQFIESHKYEGLEFL